ncbi:MAG: hypothetical protein PHG85_01930 [Candidatus Altiarchaeota archaeon]|nr:hypothetical protein [Candidatus Altiarchaeota archaeon]
MRSSVRWAAAAAVILFMIVAVSALMEATKEAAEAFYQQALDYYEGNDFRNALRNVHLARNVYESIDDDNGVVKCNQLVSKIDTILTDTQMANYYYDIASDYIIQENPTVQSYMNAKEFAQYAKDYYNRAGDGGGVIKSDDLIYRSQSEINALRNEKQQVAMSYYQMAQDSFQNSEYLKARIYALNASIIYGEILDSGGLSMTSMLIYRIDVKVNETRYNALASYDRARDYYAQEDYDNSLRYATISLQLYTSIYDQDGMTKATSLISRVNSDSSEIREKKLRLAQSYYNSAEDMLIIEDYPNATDYAKSSREIYMEFYNLAFEEEGTLSKPLQFKMRLYEGYLAQVDSLLERINRAWGTEKKLEQAQDFYIKAQEFFIKNQLESAINYAERAKRYFGDLDDYVGVNKCDALLTSIRGKMEERRNADQNYQKAFEFYNTAEFENAIIYLAKAKAIYVRILDTDGQARVENLTSRINEGTRKLDEGSEFYRRANSYFNAGDYENAKTNSQKAYDLYTEINYTLGSSNAQQILNQSTIKIDESTSTFRNNFIIGLAIVAGGAYLIIYRMKERKAFKKEMKDKKEKFEEERIMYEKQWEVRKEDETKEQVEDELRRLIEQERTSPGEGAEEKKP